jgi:hypothetical protein
LLQLAEMQREVRSEVKVLLQVILDPLNHRAMSSHLVVAENIPEIHNQLA